MQKKIVLKVVLKDEKLYSKTLGLAVSIPGVRSVALEGYDKLTVCGEGVDVAKLVTKIRERNPVKKCKWWKFCSCCKKKKRASVLWPSTASKKTSPRKRKIKRKRR